MKAEILAVGTEILLGDIVNTNAQYIAKRLADLGIVVYHQSVVGDNPERLLEAYRLAFSRADLVITTGGLGPTKDDLTKEVAFEYFGKKSVVHEASMKIIEGYFKEMDKPMAKSNVKQAYFPVDAVILPNNNGTAPGCIIEENGKIVALLPGPPREMKPMFEEAVVPYLEKFQQGVLVSKVLRVIGVGESSAEEMIEDILDKQTNPTVAPYAKDGEMLFRITAKANTKERGIKLIEPMEAAIRSRLGNNIYGEGDITLENVLGQILINKKLTIATAESCTGGMVAAKLINYPGISSVFMDGVVTYSNEAKINRLGVSIETLDTYGAVSSEVAAEMAQGIAKTAGTNIGISTTGIAGPDGGSIEKPVGLVYVGLSINGEVKTKMLKLSGDRQKIRERATMQLLDWLRRELL
ncbi:competence/damage-inducible protein A [Clostridium tagluense]|uniref:competence/damage-inducible protein A n=1 Tax=Clostridium tagluense TaxID=360422 RepID=UPI001CF12233|nr:competence/damage-inducible protein A [Clostridium tagluense]MCB2311283.1 competence/damage-inducible protein A [Clostridium tagluense]MCB2316075.1 competence/damage-inducible protein A [Clostridium tagluense]MCB2320859.1 competence/damage-inducible protein A [Clostridium tagluense]MCB2325944.1 competence/damage-inducible protein A [Clostridium tagluense]MCB2330599.1 competence/damage-inducible protein A [Clostridium tagluense]